MARHLDHCVAGSAPITNWQRFKFDGGSHNMQCDSMVLASCQSPFRESDAGEHKGLVRANVLTDLLKQQDVWLVDLLACSPLCIGNIEVLGNRLM